MLRRRRWVEAVHFEVDCLSLEIKCGPPFLLHILWVEAAAACLRRFVLRWID